MEFNEVRTSRNSPLRIDTIKSPNGGTFGMTICPGKRGPSESSPGVLWARDLEEDVLAIARWGADAVITILEDYEFEEIGVDRKALNRAIVNAGMEWAHIRVIDKGIPDERFDDVWYDIKRHIIEPIFASNGKVLVHCFGGLGRTGTVVAQYILEESSILPENVINAVRKARPGAIENSLQEEYLRGFE